MGFRIVGWWAAAMVVGCSMLVGCAGSGQTTLGRTPNASPPTAVQASGPSANRNDLPEVECGSTGGQNADTGWTLRVVTEEELLRLGERCPDLTLDTCREMLARLNIKARYLIADDIRKERPLKVPNNFGAFREWTPLPGNIPALAGVPKFILVAKDVPFLGWYANGRLLGDSPACIGREKEPTEVGLYVVEEKDADHHSRSYNNSYGSPAWMPWALRIYGTVWIHAGDLTDAHCSHGCVTLPVKPAQDLFAWADEGTSVLVVESAADLDGALKKNAGLFARHASGTVKR